MTKAGPVLVNVPSNKFYPPHIDESQALFRTHLITARLPQKITTKKLIVIEAQAGQGKTTLASQFLDFNKFDYIWYQIGMEDSDPFFVLSSLLLNLSNKFPAFSSSQLDSILKEGQVGPLAIQRCANLFLQNIDACFSHDICIVFDDIHLISNNALTNSFLEYLLETSPPKLHFLLISRHPLELKCKILRNSQAICYLKTEDLALTHLEIETLFNTILHQEISRKEAEEIHRITNGWIMGIILASDPISGRGKFWQSAVSPVPSSSPHQCHMLEYFQDEIFDQIPETHHIPFLKLALLGEIPVDLAQAITNIQDIETILSKMAQNNFFVYQLDNHQRIFRFHHFFQEFLQLQAKTKLPQTDIDHIHICEAEYYLQREVIDKAMLCYKEAGDYKTMEKILKEKGMDLIARNKRLAILALLQSIPETTLFEYNWLTLYTGLLQIDYIPQTTLPFFDTARVGFRKTGEEIGEIISLSLTIYYHYVVSGCFYLGAKLLPRTEELLRKNGVTLPVHVKIMAASNLAFGLCFFNAKVNEARSYIAMAATLAGKHDLPSFTVSSRFIQGYIELLNGNTSKFLKEAEICFSLLNDPLVGTANKLTIRIMYLCYHSMAGDHLNFSAEQQALETSIDQEVLGQTIAAPYLYVWGSSCLFSVGKTEKAMELLNRGLGSTSSAATDHMHSQILQWQAFGYALLGVNQDALSCITQSIRLRAKAGGPFHEAFNAIIAGSVYSRLGMSEFAEFSLERGLKIVKSIPSSFLQICAYLNLSFHKLVTAGPTAALSDLRIGLNLMKRHGINHFWTWEPTMMIRLLSLAVQRDIEKPFARQLARERLDVSFSDTGNIIPLLHFSLLDNFQISIGRQTLFRASNFSPSQRELLGLLLTTKGQRVSQEHAQLALWPDKPPKNARTSFDTLLNRLRKELSTRLTLPAKNYISLKKGILELNHSRIDAFKFAEMASLGIQHCKNGEWWQAGNTFRTALSCWNGFWPEDSFRNEQTISFSDQLINSLFEITLIWAKNLAKMGQSAEAITLLERTLRTLFQDERLISLLYSLYLKNHNHLKARETLDRYRLALEKLGYSGHEIEELLTESLAFS